MGRQRDVLKVLITEKFCSLIPQADGWSEGIDEGVDGEDSPELG